MAASKHPWQESDVLSMFPTLVWKLQLRREVCEPIDAAIMEALAAVGRGRVAGPGEAWQSETSLHTRESFRGFVECVEDAAQTILRFLRIGCTKFEVTGCWANVLGAGASHRMHSHPNNFLSGAYYAQTRQGADTINFHDPRIQTGIIRPPVTELTAHNTDQVVVQVKNGTLLLFPAYLQHSVDPNKNAAPRISVSFNIMFSGFTENLSKPLW